MLVWVISCVRALARVHARAWVACAWMCMCVCVSACVRVCMCMFADVRVRVCVCVHHR